MGSKRSELYFVFMNHDPEYHRLRADRTKKGASELDLYLSRKHDELLAAITRPYHWSLWMVLQSKLLRLRQMCLDLPMG
ncbi:hypothetical protein V6N13_036252 [Hibiscus sabdariffa]|uniref:Uncharacterized protein n=1 Tax=Hibiscus sabdariffa TaxID=183260 RepID=A0ABR2S717_9ROSI